MKKTTKQTYKLFWQHSKRYPRTVTALFISVTLAVALNTITPLYYKDFFDVLTTSAMPRDAVARELIHIIILILGINIASHIMYRIAGFSNIFFQTSVMRDLSNTVFDNIHHHSVGFFMNRFVGSLVRQTNRLIRGFEDIADRFTWDLWPLAIRILIILSVLFMKNAVIGTVLLLWIIAVIAINYRFSLYKLQYDTKRAAVDSLVTGDLADTITNNANIKIFTAFKNEFKTFAKLTQQQRDTQAFTWKLDEIMIMTQGILFMMLEFTIFYIAVRLWERGIITIADFVLLQAYLLTIFVHIWNIGRMIRSIYERLADAEEMVEILNTPHEVRNKVRAKKLRVPHGKIVFRNVDFAYTKTRNVLKNFNLTIEPGEKIGLVGPSGSGKTTITSLLLRYFDVIDGGIYIDGQNIEDVTQESLREHLSFVPQDPILFHRTLEENIRYGKQRASEAEILRAAKLAHCDGFIRHLPYQYKTLVGERGVRLSGGERQRVAIARAILKNAPILILDEATSSLDSQSEHLIQDALRNVMEGKTTIVIAHRLSTIMEMDRIIVIENGTIKETGTHAELQKRGGLYKKLWTMQAGGFIA